MSTLWIIFLVCFGIGTAVAVILAVGKPMLKKEAKEILERGIITDYKKLDHLIDSLGQMPNDLEAADLWKKLKDLKEKQSKTKVIEVG